MNIYTFLFHKKMINHEKKIIHIWCIFFYQVEELPFLLTRANELDRLKTTVSDLDVFFRLSDNEDGIFELVKAWKTVNIEHVQYNLTSNI